MVLPRASPLRSGFRQGLFRQTTSRIRSRVWQQTSRRTYADSHGAQASSDLPWMIGSVVVTVPAAAWLWQQGPSGAPHTPPDKGGHHGDESETTGPAADAPEHATSEEEGNVDDENHVESSSGDDKQEEGGEEKQDDGGDEKQDDGDDKKEDDGDDEKEGTSGGQGAPGGGDQKSPPGANDAKGKDSQGKGDTPQYEAKTEDKSDDKSDDSESEDSGKDTPDTSDDEGDSDGPSEINKNSKKGAGEQQRGGHPEPERAGEKNKQSQFSGGKHPYIDHPEKSKKGEGVTETAKIHGTVDVNRPAR